MNVALDAMGGDNAPVAEVAGAVAAARAYRIEVLLVGRAAEIRAELDRHETRGLKLDIVEADTVIDMHEPDPARAVRQKQDSSLVRSFALVQNGTAQACVSAGNTGAFMAAALFELKRIPGVERPAIAIVMPTPTGRVLLLDIGANVDCKPEYLAQFGLMGAVYLEHLFGLANPRVGLLSIGEEATKGNQLVQQTFPLLKAMPINFIGNVEGRDLFNGLADVVVCDGFVGNVSLKLIEGLASTISSMLREELTANPVRKLLAAGLRGAFGGLRRRMDYAEYGGAPLLGVNGVCIVAHGRSSPYAMQHALRVAKESVEHHVLDRLRESVAGASPKSQVLSPES
jgi:glycerol-3-phosphate acyltransferase PlsX